MPRDGAHPPGAGRCLGVDDRQHVTGEATDDVARVDGSKCKLPVLRTELVDKNIAAVRDEKSVHLGGHEHPLANARWQKCCNQTGVRCGLPPLRVAQSRGRAAGYSAVDRSQCARTENRPGARCCPPVSPYRRSTSAWDPAVRQIGPSSPSAIATHSVCWHPSEAVRIAHSARSR